METGIYYALRFFDWHADKPELTDNNFYCRHYTHNEYVCMYGENKLLPFGVKVGAAYIGETFNPATVDMKFICHESGGEIGITPALSGWVQTDVEDGVCIHYTAEDDFTPDDPIPFGIYHIELEFTLGATTHKFYSDTFRYIGTGDVVHIKYRNNTPLGDMIFPTAGSSTPPNDFFGEFYVETTIGRPEYPIQEEAEDDQEGDTHLLFQRYDKQKVIKFDGVESLVDACSVLRLMDEVYVNGTRVYDVFVDIRWEEDRECIAVIIITFSTNKILKIF